MKTTKAILAAIAAIAATIAGLDVSGFVSLLPASLATWLVIVPSAAAAIVHIAEAIDRTLTTQTSDPNEDS